MDYQNKKRKRPKTRFSIWLFICSLLLLIISGFYYFYFYEPIRPFKIDSPLDRELWNHNCPFNVSRDWDHATAEIKFTFGNTFTTNMPNWGDNHKILKEKYIAVMNAAQIAYDQQLNLNPPNCFENLHVYYLLLYKSYVNVCKAALQGDYKIGYQYEFLLHDTQTKIEQEKEKVQEYLESIDY